MDVCKQPLQARCRGCSSQATRNTRPRAGSHRKNRIAKEPLERKHFPCVSSLSSAIDTPICAKWLSPASFPPPFRHSQAGPLQHKPAADKRRKPVPKSPSCPSLARQNIRRLSYPPITGPHVHPQHRELHGPRPGGRHRRGPVFGKEVYNPRVALRRPARDPATRRSVF